VLCWGRYVVEQCSSDFANGDDVEVQLRTSKFPAILGLAQMFDYLYMYLMRRQAPHFCAY
jgi:hypothetical protein